MNSSIVITPPAAEVLDLATVKSFLKIDHDDEDTLLSLFVTSAREQVERWCGISIGEQVREWYYDVAWLKPYAANIRLVEEYEPRRNIKNYYEATETEIPYGPVLAVTAASYFEDNDYTAGTLNEQYFTAGSGFVTFRPTSGDRWKVEYTAGYDEDTLPAGLKLIWLQFIAYLYTNRQDEVTDMPRFIKYVLQPYKRTGLI